MKGQMIHQEKREFVIFLKLLIMTLALFYFIPNQGVSAAQTDVQSEIDNHMLYISASRDAAIYKDGMFDYIITSEDNKEVRLIGIECNDKSNEFTIPGKATINGATYTVSMVSIINDYCGNDSYSAFYSSVTRLIFDDSFTGIAYNPGYAFPNLSTMEFTGNTVPEGIYEQTSNSSAVLDTLFIVPQGMEAAYQKVIHEYMYYYNGSDLYEQDIDLTPTVITANDTEAIERETFSYGGFIYQVLTSAKNGSGTVKLLGIQWENWQKRVLDNSYLALPKQVKNNGYTYRLTQLGRFSLVLSGATAIVVPDTVTKMDSYVFDNRVELLFLSKNCKVIPSRMITDENNETNLQFISVPEGVTTISANAFSNFPQYNRASIILPGTIKSIGKQALYDFKLVTFINKKPIKNIASAIKNGTTVKVNKASIPAYKSLFSSKVSVIAARNIKKSTKISVNKSSVTMAAKKKVTLTGTFSKGSNENVYWHSSNTDIFKISSKGVITSEKAGTAYAIAYSRTSGLYKAVKVTVR